MKYLKKFENKEYIKIGDRVKYIKNKQVPIIDPNWYEVIEIDFPYWTDDIQYKIDKLTDNGNRFYETKWTNRDKLITELEINTNKYNI